MLVEKRLDPMCYRKWNSNHGFVHPTHGSPGQTNVPASGRLHVDPLDVPQAFTHFTYHCTNRKYMVCDLQGVLNTAVSPPLYELTDPAIHYKSMHGRTNVYGRSDRGVQGMVAFMKTHTCSALCHRLLEATPEARPHRANRPKSDPDSKKCCVM